MSPRTKTIVRIGDTAYLLSGCQADFFNKYQLSDGEAVYKCEIRKAVMYLVVEESDVVAFNSDDIKTKIMQSILRYCNKKACDSAHGS